jgi:hypothetical protein
MHGFNGYKEVIETVAWGLEQLGHRAAYFAVLPQREKSVGPTEPCFGTIGPQGEGLVVGGESPVAVPICG